jgi:hypothetical protein
VLALSHGHKKLLAVDQEKIGDQEEGGASMSDPAPLRAISCFQSAAMANVAAGNT